VGSIPPLIRRVELRQQQLTRVKEEVKQILKDFLAYKVKQQEDNPTQLQPSLRFHLSEELLPVFVSVEVHNEFHNFMVGWVYGAGFRLEQLVNIVNCGYNKSRNLSI
jgi:hypothetical protein